MAIFYLIVFQDLGKLNVILLQEMAFGREWDNERELAIKNNGDAEKM